MKTILVRAQTPETPSMSSHSSSYEWLGTNNEVIEPDISDVTTDPNDKQSDKLWNQLTPRCSPHSSSGYQSSQTSLASVDEAIDGNTEDNKCDDNKSQSNDQQLTKNSVTEVKMEISDWDYEEFDPNNPYLYEPLTYPPEQTLNVPTEVSKLFYIPSKQLPKRLQRKRVNRSPEIKPKISKKTGRPKRSSQFIHPESPSEGSDSD